MNPRVATSPQALRLRVVLLFGMAGIILLALAINWQWWRGPGWRVEIGKRCSEHAPYIMQTYCAYDLRVSVLVVFGDLRTCAVAGYETLTNGKMVFICLP